MSDLSGYMKDRLTKYIQQNIDRGYTLNQIRKTLLNNGHNSDVIEAAISKVDDPNKIASPNVTLKEKSTEELIIDLRRYIDSQITAGHKKQDIKKHLLSHGHNIQIINQALDDFKDNNSHQYEGFRIRLVQLIVPISLLLMLLFIINISVILQAPFMNVFLGFSATIMSILLVYIVLERTPERRLTWLVAPLVCIIFYVMGVNSGASVMSTMNVLALTFLNLLMSLAFTLVLTSVHYG